MSLSYRVIARLDIKGPHVIKGVQMEGVRKIGDPIELAKRYAEQGADELLFLHVASLYGHHDMVAVLEAVATDVFVPLTAGGGVASIQDFDRLLRAGADKVAINTAAIKRPELIRECADHFGSQAVVVSVEARLNKLGGWFAYMNCGRDNSGKMVCDWAEEAQALGAGEILITSIDRDGTRAGSRYGTMPYLDIPVVYSGGVTVATAVEDSQIVDALAIGTALHYGETIQQFKAALGACHCVR